jgi:hypothetical protein
MRVGGPCGGLILNLVPISKVGKILEAGYKAVKAVRAFDKAITKARTLLSKVGLLKKESEKAVTASSCLIGKHSFVASTRVLMADGSTKPIAEVGIGDKVKATDPETGDTTSREVVATIVHSDEGDMTKLTVASEDGSSSGAVDATSWHPVWVGAENEFVRIGDLEIGQALTSADGSRQIVSDVQSYSRVEPVYDLTVEGVHTFYVLAGTSILVHNCGSGGTDIDGMTERVDDLHSLIPEGGQGFRTTGLLHAEGAEGSVGLAPVGARSNLTLVQRADVMDSGELAVSMSNGAHAEVKLVMAAEHLQLRPTAIAASRPFCPECTAFLVGKGATILSPRTAAWR